MKSIESFSAFVQQFFSSRKKPCSFGIFRLYRDESGEEIAIRLFTVNHNCNFGTAAVLMDVLAISDSEITPVIRTLDNENVSEILEHFQPFSDDGKQHDNIEAFKYAAKNPGIELGVIFYFDEAFFQGKPVSMFDAHFRLAMLSRRYVKPREISFEGVFLKLPNVVYTTSGMCFSPDDWNKRWQEFTDMGVTMLCTDKFPPFAWANPIPSGVRIANTAMVRHGAYLAEGTTVMNYGFVNYNAGTLGVAMIEGRISVGTIVGEGTDVGAGSGFLGALPGGNSILMSTGKNCLIGAMAECGIPLGDNVCIAAGVVFTPNTPIDLVSWKRGDDGKFETDPNGKPVEVSRLIVKAIELLCESDYTLRRNSMTGILEAIPVPNGVRLNDVLHKNE